MFTDRAVNVAGLIEADMSTTTVPVLLSVLPLQGEPHRSGEYARERPSTPYTDKATRNQRSEDEFRSILTRWPSHH